MKRWLGLIGILCVLMPLSAQAWWQDAWSFRKKITLDTTPQGGNVAEPAGRVPMLVRLHGGNFIFTDAKEDGSDIRFVAGDDKTPLNFHVESWDAALGIAALWVDVPQLPAGATSDLWMYYGNPDAPAAADSKTSFDADYAAVYHFGESAGAPQDATANAVVAQAPPPASIDGSIVGRGARFDGSGPMLLPASANFGGTGGSDFTFSAWIKPTAAQPATLLYARRTGSNDLLIGLDQGVPFAQIDGANGTRRTTMQQALPAGTWSHLAITADASGVINVFVDGHLATATTAAPLPALSGPTAIGGDVPGAPPGYAPFAGEMDELRLSRVPRPAALLLVDAITEGADSKLVAYGEDEKQSGVGFGYFGIIVKSVTIDAWVVIGILMVMALVSWVVMWTKGRYVGRVQSANEEFEEKFRSITRDLLSLEGESGLEHSSVFRLYRAGVRQIKHRFDAEGRHALSAESIEAIRAVVDATLVRENQRLSRSLVLLTIAISGGPFLGLLGTVVGVMITFAAIAAAGDVNINAIAPGISAALLATVAGLAVAIPALFGYNILVTRNKNVSADMHVFVDEFVTRMAELYRAERS